MYLELDFEINKERKEAMINEKIIELSIDHTRKVWVAEFFGPEREQIKDLMGASGATLPTPFTDRCSFEKVAYTISKRNPDYRVINK